VRYRSAKAQIHLTVNRARAALVSTRTALANAAWGLTKSYGERLTKCGTGQLNCEIAKGLGLQPAERGGRNAKKRAVVAVARKLAVLLHRLWVSGEVYKPLRNNHKMVSAVA
jgi:hypothetical protein